MSEPLNLPTRFVAKRVILMTVFHIGIILLLGIFLGYLFKSMLSKASQQPDYRLPPTVKPSSKSTTELYDLAQRMMGFFEQAVTGDPCRSDLLTGDAGVGKTTHIRALAQQLAEKGRRSRLSATACRR
jgi:hypothetical protein